jgi:hypothetical protein
MRKKVEITGRFKAIDEAGNEGIISIFTTFIEAALWSEQSQWLPGTKAHKLHDGTHLNPAENDTFQEAGTSKIWRRI